MEQAYAWHWKTCQRRVKVLILLGLCMSRMYFIKGERTSEGRTLESDWYKTAQGKDNDETIRRRKSGKNKPRYRVPVTSYSSNRALIVANWTRRILSFVHLLTLAKQWHCYMIMRRGLLTSDGGVRFLPKEMDAEYMEWIELMFASVTLLLWTGLRFYLLENVDMDEYWIAVGNSKPLMELVLQRQK